MNVEPDVFTDTLNRFCAGLSEKVAYLAEQESDREAVELVAEGLLTAIRETTANLMLLEIECERLLRHD